MRRVSASDRVVRRARGAAVVLSLAVGAGLLVCATTGAAADTGSGPDGDGSLHLLPEVITNAGISAGSSGDFPVKGELFLPRMERRAAEREKEASEVTAALGRVAFEPADRSQELDRFYAGPRSGLFADYRPAAAIDRTGRPAAHDAELWAAAMLVAAVPVLFLVVFVGWKTASRRAKHHG
ncbi:hypothetical protein [Leifsonia xyli]|uniref:hypothetical protein n=1 Tax=Leifsonia xyli TaxID=1575 RepID=UPI003D678113